MAEAGPGDEPREDEGPPVIFPSWNSLYLTVIAYAFLLILVFYILSVTLDYSGGGQ